MKPTTHYSGRFLSLREVGDWEYVTRSNASGVVVLVALTDDAEVLLVEQFRVPVGRRVIELPAGLIGDQAAGDESPIEAARRELEEETGYLAESLELLMSCPSSAGMSDEMLHFVLATRLEQTGPGGGDESEDIEVHRLALGRVDEWLDAKLADGSMLDPKIYSGLYWLRRRGFA